MREPRNVHFAIMNFWLCSSAETSLSLMKHGKLPDGYFTTSDFIVFNGNTANSHKYPKSQS